MGLPLVLLQESRQQLQQPLAWQQPHEFYPEVNRPLPEQQRLLQALVSDLYMHPNSHQLFASLYPGESYNPGSSPLRVSQAMKRLRLDYEHVRKVKPDIAYCYATSVIKIAVIEYIEVF